MKRKDVLLYCLGGSFVISGLSIFGFYTYYNNKVEKTIQENLDKSTIYVSSTETSDNSSSSSKSGSTLIDTTTEVANVDGDQTVEKVKTYSNVVSIPQLNILAYVNEGVGHDALAGGIGHHEGTANLGEPGNCVLAGHASDIYNCILNDLNKIELFDSFLAYDSKGKEHKYYVTKKYVCEPNDTGILATTDSDISKITLYTCTNKGSQRLVIEGLELTDSELAKYKDNIRNQYVTNMVNYNLGYNIEPVYTEILVRELARNRHYTVDYIKSDKKVNPIVTNLYGIAPRRSVTSTAIGFDINK